VKHGVVGVLCQRTVNGRTGRVGLVARSRVATELDVELDAVTTRLQATAVDRVTAQSPRPRRASCETVQVT